MSSNVEISREELKVLADNEISAVAKYKVDLEKIAQELYSAATILSEIRYREIEQRLVGMYTFVNGAYKTLDALVDNLEVTHYCNIRTKAEIDSVKFVSEATSRESRAYTKDLHIALAELESLVDHINQTLCTARGHRYAEKTETKHYK